MNREAGPSDSAISNAGIQNIEAVETAGQTKFELSAGAGPRSAFAETGGAGTRTKNETSGRNSGGRQGQIGKYAVFVATNLE